MLNIGKLCLDTDFNFRVIREEDKEDFSFADDKDLIVVKGINGSLKRNFYEQRAFMA